MKKLIFVLGLGLVFVACGDNAKDNQTAETPTHTTEATETPASETAPAVEPQAEETKNDAQAQVAPEQEVTTESSDSQPQNDAAKEESAAQ
ncbi:hypothetical protein OQH61_01840 [Helicobacter sp. MIT 21-1697]|uniref:hypothetical protein n=1 Tax=Helicobacter sp. MIT 21-1697 TaxID=2993733 RepID=UPI00224A8A19|nr:hypothetical protein [Helicobacter sp. MIT 21-1697]MCX2716472.1 hypothetical protein [Helicobacter sp. MIT 21-1697]